MANVTFEGDAFKDPRFGVLGILFGTSKFDARGRMLEVWSYCTEECTYFVRAEVLDALVDKVGGSELLATAGLAAKVDDGTFRVLGTKGRVEWLKRLKKNARLGGQANKRKLAERASQEGSRQAIQQASQQATPQASPPYSYPDPEVVSEKNNPGKAEGDPGGFQEPLRLQPSLPKPRSSVAQLQHEFVSWFAQRYKGAIYAWGKSEAGKASQLVKRAGAGGVPEIMRRARIAGAQGWRQGTVSLGTLLGAWNDLAVAPEQARATSSRPSTPSPSDGVDRHLAALDRDARRLGLVDAEGNPT
jgi:hypothetical protein